MISSNYMQIIRNTGMLYIRMLFAMAVTLYTSRVILDVLGVADFGLYHVVAGFVAILGFLHGAMTAASQRFFAYELGGGNAGGGLSNVFTVSVNIHAVLAILIVLVAETAGLWFVSHKLNIPMGREEGAVWVYHLAVIAFASSVLMVPFTALIIAHERMGAFSVISIVDVTLKLAAVFLLQHYFFDDRLIAYAALTLAVALGIFAIYVGYCRIAFKEVRYKWAWNTSQLRTMLSYTGWNTWGNLAAVLSGQGTNILLNVFFGPSINAARAIAYQANSAIFGFVQNMQVAINPQIIKMYAGGRLDEMRRLAFYGAKYSFFLLFIISLPVAFSVEALLAIWLVSVPPYAAIFLQLVILNSLVDSFSGPLMAVAQATGRVRLYQSVVGGILLINLPASYLALVKGADAYFVVCISIAISMLALAARLVILRSLVSLSASDFLRQVVLPASLVSVVVVLPLIVIKGYLGPVLNGTGGLLMSLVLVAFYAVLAVWFIGLTEYERSYVLKWASIVFGKSSG